MAEYIPVAKGAGEKRKVLDDSQVSAEAFDEGVLTDIERRLESAPAAKPAAAAGEKVELDKADLPALDTPIPPPDEEPPPEVEVDLGGEAPLEAEPAPEEAPASAGRKKLFIMAGAGGLALVLVAGGLWWWLSRPKAAVPVIAQKLFSEAIPDHRLTLRLDLDPFLIPLQKTDKGRLLKLGVSLEVTDPAEREVLARQKTQVRDAIYRLMRDRPAEEVGSERAKSLLQTQIKTELNHLLGHPAVFQVYFTDFFISG